MSVLVMQAQQQKMFIKYFLFMVALIVLCPKSSCSNEKHMTCQELLEKLDLASEQLRMDDPKSRIRGVKMLFDLEGFYEYTTLQYLWLAESDQKVRNEILRGFKKIGDHRYIADPGFPQYWMRSLEQYNEIEKQKRIKELKRFFSDQVTKYLESEANKPELD